MDNSQQKSGWGGATILVFIIAAIGTGVYFGFFFKKGAPANPPTNEKTSDVNFEKIGNLIKNNPGLKPDVWYLTHEEPDKPALNTELVMDLNSACLYGMDRELPCATLDFDQGERIKVTGTEKDGVVTVKTLMPYLVKGAPWEDVAAFIADCQVVRANQTQTDAVKVWLKNEMEIWTEEPAPNDIITETAAAKEACGEIPVASYQM